MASLFKNKIIKEKIEKFHINDFESKIEILKAWYKKIESGEMADKTETQCEQEFNDNVFKIVLDYRGFINDIYTIQPKDNVETGGGQMPDATLGYFSKTDRKVVAVVEIKDVNTSLDKSQRREGSLTPVQQAFKYKPQYKECGFVIATNFSEIRLFRDNQLDYEMWTLKELVNEKNNYFNFRKFYYLLCEKNFIAEGGKSETEKLLSAIRIKQEEITVKFYKEYKELRQILIQDIVKNNNISKANFYHKAVEKAQKIIDRIVFVCFFEDSGLLPENKLTEIVEFSGQHGLSAWGVMKDFFKSVDEGSSKMGIPNGYNGELFKYDEELNNLKISDDITKKFVDLTKYDFKEDLSVNILGHIFEQSISDLEKLRNFAEGKEEDNKKEKKRKQDGIFYTPEYIVDYIVRNSLGKYIEEKEFEILKENKIDNENIKLDKTYNKKIIKAYTEYNKFLREIKVLDPACGSGAFLVKVFDYLLEEHKRVFKIIRSAEGLGENQILSDDEYIKDILKKNIFGVDLNEESVEITKLSLWLKSAKIGQKLVTLKNNIKCGNSLISDSEIAGSKAFDWNKEFSEIMSNGGFDVIVGNPPYVNIFNVKNERERKYLQKNYKVNKNKTDLYAFFTELSNRLLKEKGTLGFIFSNSWLGTNSFLNFRDYLLENTSIKSIVYLPAGVFVDATVTTILIFFSKVKVKSNQFDIVKFFEGNFSTYSRLSYDEIRNSPQHTFNIENKFELKIKKENLGEIAKFSLGIKTSDDKRFIINEKRDESTYPAVNGKSIGRYMLSKPNFYIWYRPDLMMEKKGAGPRNLEIFFKKKIFIQDVAKKIIATLDEKRILSTDTLSLIYDVKEGYDIKYILAILNSKFVNYWFKSIFPSGLHIKINQLKEIPVPKTDFDSQNFFSKKVDEIMALTSTLNEELIKSIEIIKSEFGVEKINKNLGKFYTLSFDEFINESNIKLTITKKEELLDYFNKQKEELINLKNKINILDREIDDMVYKIYRLTPEEITVVENGK